jgi:hypothetical protein
VLAQAREAILAYFFLKQGVYWLVYVSTRLAKKAKIVLGLYPRESRTIMTTFSTIHLLNRNFSSQAGQVEGGRRAEERQACSGLWRQPPASDSFRVWIASPA